MAQKESSLLCFVSKTSLFEENLPYYVISGMLNGSGDHGDVRQNGAGKETAV